MIVMTVVIDIVVVVAVAGRCARIASIFAATHAHYNPVVQQRSPQSDQRMGLSKKDPCFPLPFNRDLRLKASVPKDPNPAVQDGTNRFHSESGLCSKL